MNNSGHAVTLLGTGLIGMFYTQTLHGQRGVDRIHMVYSRNRDNAARFAAKWGIPHHTDDLKEAVNHPATDTVVVGIPNDAHAEAVQTAAAAGKSILCTKPLGRNASEAWSMLKAVEKAGVFAGYLEDLVYPPKTRKSLESVQRGAIGQVLWVRSRETHAGPHSDWFWDRTRAGGGAVIDMGCHCIEIIRTFIGKGIRPVEVMCWTDTLVHPISAEDHGIGLIRFENGAMGQFEVSWAFRGGMDLRDEVSGTEGTIWIDHFLRTGFELYTAAGQDGYVAEKADSEKGWLFPVGDEVHELGYTHMFRDMFDAMDSDRDPEETFYDGYVVNAVVDAAYRSASSRRWEPVTLKEWRTAPLSEAAKKETRADSGAPALLKKEQMPDGRIKLILKDARTGRIYEKIAGGNDSTEGR